MDKVRENEINLLKHISKTNLQTLRKYLQEERESHMKQLMMSNDELETRRNQGKLQFIDKFITTITHILENN